METKTTKDNFEIEVDETKGGIMESLGISEERCHELCDLIHNAVKDGKIKTFTGVMKEASKHAQNHNELVFIGWTVGVGMARSNPLEGLLHIIHQNHDDQDEVGEMLKEVLSEQH